uniref:Uncharacterized protein n=1 Tax=Siphoviridae sp. ctnFo11 TaxID=2826454 RepID=A0A8S5N5U4_9CAUD|nr:MAG TPA: hypothetical protein [Siphoviridae sp. ctnFo11]
MAIAGRVAIVPKGDWSVDATYKRLDAVTYNNTLYFAKKDVPAGIATSNTEYWSKSIVGGAGGVATADEAGVVKPADGLTVAEDGTLKVNIDGTTLTMDQVNNVIKLADALKDAINGAFPSANVANNQITTVEGFALDARQANPNIDGSLAKQISNLNGSLKKLTIYSHTVTGTTSFDASFSTGLSCNRVIVLNAYTNDSNGGIEVAIVSVEDGTYYARCYDKSDGYLTDKKITIHIDYILRRME